MALNVFELFGKIAIDSSGAKSGLDSAVGHAQKAENKLAATFKRIGVAVAAAFSVKAIVDFGKSCTQTAADIAAEESAFAQIMGDYAGTAQEKLQAVSKTTGVTATRMTSAMTSMTAKFKGLGYNVADATTLAADGLQITADAAAFCNMSLGEAQSHLNSFINGSYEGGEAIQLFANDTQMASWAIQQGLAKDKKAWAEMNEGMKQTIRLQYAMTKYKESGIWGQSLVEAEEYGNIMAELKEHWRQFQGIIGKPILQNIVLPAMRKLNEFMPKLNNAVQRGIRWLDEGYKKVKAYCAEKFKATFGFDFPSWSEVKTAVSTWWTNGGLAKAVADACNWTLNLFGAPANVTAADVSSILSSWWSSTVTFVQDACTWVLKLFNNPKETVAEVGTAIGTWWSGVKPSVIEACSWVLSLFGAPEGDPVTVVSNWWAGVKESVQNACTWVLRLPETQALIELTGEFWEYVASGNAAKDATEGIKTAIETVASVIRGVISSVSEFVGWLTSGSDSAAAFQAAVAGIATAVGVFVAALAVQTAITNFTTWIKTATAAIVALNAAMMANPIVLVIALIAGLVVAFVVLWNKSEGFRQFWIDLWETIKTTVSNAEKAMKTFFTETLPGWWNDICSAIDSAATAVLGFFGIDMPEDWSLTKSISDAFNAVISAIQTAIDKVKELLGLNGTVTVNTINNVQTRYIAPGGVGPTIEQTVIETAFPRPTGGASQSGSGIVKNSFDSFTNFFNGHATGLDYVPYDNYLARLHKGEAVLTSSEADVWRGGGSTGRVEAALTQMSDILRVIAQNTGADKQVVLDTGAVIGQLAPGIDAQLGMYSNRKGRRN